MDNPEYTFQILEVFSKIKTKEIPRELEEYISYVARTGDPVFQWSLVKVLIKEKLLAVLNEFIESNPSLDIPPCPNVDPFNYEAMKSNLLMRLDSFILPPFTIQRICELLAAPRKEYNRIDKYMRAVEKNVLVVSACELSIKRGLETDGNEAMINGILYDKVNDSLNAFSNHFPNSEDRNVDELNTSGKLDVPEPDAMQQMLDDSWNDGTGDEFKLNESSTSSLGVSFDNELHFVTEKSSNDGDKVTAPSDCETKKLETRAYTEADSLLGENSLQSMIAESTSAGYSDSAKCSTSDEEPTTSKQFMKEEVSISYAFKSEISATENSSGNVSTTETSVSEEPESFSVSNDSPSSSFTNEPINVDSSLLSSEDLAKDADSNESIDESSDFQHEYKKKSFGYNFADVSLKSDLSGEFNFEHELSDNSQLAKDATAEPSSEQPERIENEALETPEDSVETQNNSLTTLFNVSEISSAANEAECVLPEETPEYNLKSAINDPDSTQENSNLTKVLEYDLADNNSDVTDTSVEPNNESAKKLES